MKSTLITGAAGFIGASLARALLEKGESVIGVDNFVTGQESHVVELNKYPRFTFLKHDIIKPLPKLKAISYQLSAIYHLACPTGVPNLTRLGEEMLLSSSYGTRNVLALARVHNAKIMFTSSSEVYGNPTITPQRESYTGNVDPVGIRSTYEEGKRFAEALIMLYVRKYKVNAAIARVFNVYGPGMSPSETRVIPRMITQALSNKSLTIHGDGSQTRTFCYIDDMVQGLILLMEKGKSGEVYNIGSDQEITILQLAKLINELTPYSLLLTTIPRPTHDHDSRKPDLAKINNLGWKPATPLREGLQKTIEYFKSL